MTWFLKVRIELLAAKADTTPVTGDEIRALLSPVQIECVEHKPVQHRDQQRPWCDNCGRAADGELIGRPKMLR